MSVLGSVVEPSSTFHDFDYDNHKNNCVGQKKVCASKLQKHTCVVQLSIVSRLLVKSHVCTVELRIIKSLLHGCNLQIL